MDIRPLRKLFYHVFIDIVEFTAPSRSVEDQVVLARRLNQIVKDALNEHAPHHDYLLLPTGDGMCISILADELVLPRVPFDVHLKIALTIRHRVRQNVGNAAEQFALRTGIATSDDAIVTDINGKFNVIGDGINRAQRVMSGADKDMILVDALTHKRLTNDPYYVGKFQRFMLDVKHNQLIEVFLYNESLPDGPLISTPSRLFDPPVGLDDGADEATDHSTERSGSYHLKAKNFEYTDDREIDIVVTDSTTIRFTVSPGYEGRPYIFYFIATTNLEEKVWIGFHSGRGDGRLDGPGEHSYPVGPGEGPGENINVRTVVGTRHKHNGLPMFRGEVVRITRLRLRGGESGSEQDEMAIDVAISG